MGETILLMILAAAAGAGAMALWQLPNRRAIRALREAVERIHAGNWRQRVDVQPTASSDVRRLAELTNSVADQTLRQLKDLSRQRGDLQALVDALPGPVLLADTRRKIILINRPAVEFLSVPADRALGEQLEAVVSEPAILAIFDQAANLDRDAKREDGAPALPLRRELRVSRAGTKLIFQVVATRTDAGGVLVVLRDISTLDATLRMKSDFVANASHELRTPIAAIRAAFETLEEVTQENAERFDPSGRSAAQRCLTIIGGHLQRLQDMLRDLMDLSRVESGEARPTFETLRVGDLARDVRQILGSAAAEKKIDLRLPEGEAANLKFTSDHRLLMLAVKNLVENAIKYTPDGGTVQLEAERRDLSTGAAAMHRQLTGGRPFHEVILRVSDTGPGIAREHLDRIFERFYQVDTARTGTNPRTSVRGTGLGLSIVKHAINALGGSVRVESQVGKGSTFTLTLPQTTQAPVREEASV